MKSMLTVRINKDVKDKATAILKKNGMTISSLMQTIISEIVATGDIPITRFQTQVSKEEIFARINALNDLELPVPINLSDDEIRDARLGEKHGFAA
ncbi:MAG: type II toxin-antitoxin system RelB/DinJ family antitoxin [Coriobacteriales bacterium]|nr:type II toxin-antitoxin system RelB/DinJ family antitoxin [Coriobacteriales bacterium]